MGVGKAHGPPGRSLDNHEGLSCVSMVMLIGKGSNDQVQASRNMRMGFSKRYFPTSSFTAVFWFFSTSSSQTTVKGSGGLSALTSTLHRANQPGSAAYALLDPEAALLQQQGFWLCHTWSSGAPGQGNGHPVLNVVTGGI